MSDRESTSVLLESLKGHALTASEKASVLITLSRLADMEGKLDKLVKEWMGRDSFQHAERWNGYSGYWRQAADELTEILQPNVGGTPRERSAAK